jgi:hypothetical protein
LHSFGIHGFAFVGGLLGLFHAGDFFFRQKSEAGRAFLRGEPAIVLQTEADKEVDFPVGHVCDLLDGPLCLVVMGQERQFAGQFRIDGPLDEAKERFHLGCHIDIEEGLFLKLFFHNFHKLDGKRERLSGLFKGDQPGDVVNHAVPFASHFIENIDLVLKRFSECDFSKLYGDLVLTFSSSRPESRENIKARVACKMAL